MENANLVSGSAKRRGAGGWGVWFRLVGVLVIATLSACDRDRASGVEPPKTVAHFFEIRVGDRPVRMQLAVQETEMARGLMERRDLGPDEGMLFVYERPQRMSFWMRNTPTPLDIGFFGRDGALAEIYPLHPFDETSLQTRSDALQLALEMNQGWFREHGIKPGVRIDLPAVVAALKARGFEPRRFGLDR